MKALIIIFSFFFATVVFASSTVSLPTDLVCGEIPMFREAGNTEDEDIKCQIHEKYKVIEVGEKRYSLDTDRFYKIYIEHRDGDEYAYLMYNDIKIDEKKTQEIHIELAGYGTGLYETVEWRVNPVKKGLKFSGLILGKVVKPEVQNAKGEVIELAKVVYQSFKLNKEKSCRLNLLSTDLDEARRIADRLSCH